MIKLNLPLPRFLTAPQSIVGAKSILSLKGLQAVKVVLIIGNSLLKNKDKYKAVINSINCHKLEVIKRSWKNEPTLEELKNSLSKLESIKPDCIIALGGGSIIDGAKILWAFYEHPTMEKDLYSRPFAIPPLRGKCSFIAVPTTVGTGSEVSSSAIYYDELSNKKVPMVTHDFLPDLVILDPELLSGIPHKILLSSIIDAISHSVEGYVSKINNPLMDVYAEQSMSLIYHNWEKVWINNNNIESLERLQYAAMMAGWVQNHCIIGVCHALAHQLGQIGVPHGIANAIFLKHSIKLNRKTKEVDKRYEELARRSHIGNSSEHIIKLIESILNKNAFPFNLSNYIKGEKAEKNNMITNALDDPGARYNPVSVDYSMLSNIWDSAL